MRAARRSPSRFKSLLAEIAPVHFQRIEALDAHRRMSSVQRFKDANALNFHRYELRWSWRQTVARLDAAMARQVERVAGNGTR